MEIVFLGTRGAVPTPTSGNVSFVIRGNGFSLLVDVSGNPVQSLLKVGLDPLALDALVLTHAHTDHLYALPSLFHTLWMMHRKKELTLFANPPTEQKARDLLRVFGLEERSGLFPYRFVSILEEPICIPFPVSAESNPSLFSGEAKPLSKGEKPEILFFPTLHSIPTHGFLLKAGGRKILYTSDTSPLSTRVTDTVDVLIHEASGVVQEEERLNSSGHSSGRQAAEAAIRLGARELFLCHFPAEAATVNTILREARQTFRASGSQTIIRKPIPYRWYSVFTVP